MQYDFNQTIIYTLDSRTRRDGNWSALSGNSISQNYSTVFNQEWFPANNSFANFGEINKTDSITNFDSANSKQLSSSDTRGKYFSSKMHGNIPIQFWKMNLENIPT